MWTATLDSSPQRNFIVRLLNGFWPTVGISSLAPLRVQNLPRQALPAPTWVRVRNRLAGICAADLHLIHADRRIAPAAVPRFWSRYPGREVVGEVIEPGDQVRYLRAGDRVVWQYGPNCISSGMQPPCHFCASGNYELCEQDKLPGPAPFGGGWSEEMLLHEQQLFRIPALLSDEQAVLLAPTAIALHAVLRFLPRSGERALIVGSGTIGLLVLQVLRLLSPQTEVSVLIRHAFQVEQATRLGATHIIYPQHSYSDIQRATRARLYRGPGGNKVLAGAHDVIYDTVGSQDSLQHALRWLRARGTLVLVGREPRLVKLDLTPLWYREANLIGSASYGSECWPVGSQGRRSTFSLASELIGQGKIQPEKLVTHHFAVTNYRHALLTVLHKEQSHAIKAVFDHSLLPASVVPGKQTSSQQKLSGARVSRRQAALDRPSTALAARAASLEEEDELEDTLVVPVIKRAVPSAEKQGDGQKSATFPESLAAEGQLQMLPETPIPPTLLVLPAEEAAELAKANGAAKRADQLIEQVQANGTAKQTEPEKDDASPALAIAEAQEAAIPETSPQTEDLALPSEPSESSEPPAGHETPAMEEAASEQSPTSQVPGAAVQQEEPPPSAEAAQDEKPE
ncbi:hypothetical protein EPA93_30445 [Ktedonosporobacter rubrisoli]|uniref:Enoyl reductase (ER) domain-containing protein n=1 Tax=Ktedonosporobacter rubrisoli TaxID=2509675 RepID=A0A4V0YZK8_KTERU|nr:zinc-binding dehydrogenase [Ktedonosporobacter rubrisoli]QBD80071.1 hypothetical protein EPA93_30445 [Ktedonosporobacter rubrisoli]